MAPIKGTLDAILFRFPLKSREATKAFFFNDRAIRPYLPPPPSSLMGEDDSL